MSGTRTSIYLTDEIRQKLGVPPFGGRGASEAVSLIVDRYSAIMCVERRKLADVFTAGEWAAMRDACKGAVWQPAGVIRDGVLHRVQDCLDDVLAACGVERAALEGKLRTLGLVQQYALAEELEASG